MALLALAIMGNFFSLLSFDTFNSSALFRGFIFFVSPVLCFFIFYNNPDLLGRLFFWILVLGVINTVAMLFQYFGLMFTGYFVSDEELLLFDAIAKFRNADGEIAIRPPGIVGNYHESAIVQLCALSIAFFQVYMRRKCSISDFLLGVFFYVGVFVSMSRANMVVASMLMSLIGIMFFFPKKTWNVLFIVLGAAFGLISIFAFSALLFDSVQLDNVVELMWSIGGVGASERGHMFVEAFQKLMVTNPVFGLGFGQFGRPSIGTQPMFFGINFVDYPLITFLGEHGLLGLAFLFLLGTYWFYNVDQAFRPMLAVVYLACGISFFFGDFFMAKFSKHFILICLGSWLGFSYRRAS